MLGHLGRIYNQSQERAASCSPPYHAQGTTSEQAIHTILWFAILLCYYLACLYRLCLCVSGRIQWYLPNASI
jgi:hypothetical protein